MLIKFLQLQNKNKQAFVFNADKKSGPQINTQGGGFLLSANREIFWKQFG